MDESLQRLNEQVGGGQGGAPNTGPGPGAGAPTPPPPARPEGPGSASPGEGSGPGTGNRSGESSRPGENGPTPNDGPRDGGGGPVASTNPEGGSGRGEPGTGTRTDDGRRDESGALPDPTSQGLRDTTRSDGADRSTDPWTTSPRGDQGSPDAPALRDPNENGNPSPRDGDRSSPATPREDSGSPAPSTDGGGSGDRTGGGDPPTSPGEGPGPSDSENNGRPGDHDEPSGTGTREDERNGGTSGGPPEVLRKAPPERVINDLRGFRPRSTKIGPHSFLLQREGMQHILQRHHPDYWNGSTKRNQTYFEESVGIEDIPNIVEAVLLQNKETILQEGSNGGFRVTGVVRGQEYVVGTTFGRVGMLYPKYKQRLEDLA